MKEKLAALYALQQQDSAIDILKKQYALLDSGKEEQSAYQAAQNTGKEAEAALQAARVAVADTEMEQKTVEEKRAGYETKLYSGTVSNPKELQAMQDEVDMLARNRDRLGEKLKSLLTELEECREREAGAKQALATLKASLKAKQTAYKAEAEQIVAQAKVLIAQRAEAAKQVAPPLLQRYEALRKLKGGLAVVPMEDSNACGGCKMGLASSVVRRVQSGDEIETCDNCGRILVSGK